MNVSFENPDKINGLLTITIEDDDYKAEVEKTLKEYRKKANVPGFRPGQVPMGLIRRQFGSGVKMESINKVIGEQLQKYITDNNIAMLGEPLASEKQEPQELEKDGPYTFMFDIAVAPEINITLDANDTIDYYEIAVDDALIDSRVETFGYRFGQNVEADNYRYGDVLKGDLRQLDAEGNTVEGGLTVESASVMPKYVKNDDQMKLFDDCKPGDIITFNPSKAYEGSDYELAQLLKVDREKVKEYDGDFSYQITSVQHFEKHAVDQELFDLAFGKDVVKDEKGFRDKIAEVLKAQLALDSDVKFLQDLRKYAEDKVGQLTYPDTLLKRIIKQNNKDKDQEFIDKNYDASIKELNWSLIRNKIAVAQNVKINDDDVKNAACEMAKAQFAQYGMSNVPQEYVENYANELLKKQESLQQFIDRAVDAKLVEALKAVVTLNKKPVTLDEFNKMMGE
jgi:trigger factor